MSLLLQGLFWLAALAVTWTYLGYPLFIRWLAHRRPRLPQQAPLQPTLSFIVPALNEEAVIAAKLENLLGLDYPPALREIIIIADGSTDRTVEIVQAYADRGIKLLFQPERRGKIAAMNRAVPEAQGEILIFSDANTFMEPGSIRALVRNFADPQVACVSGEKRIRPAAAVQAQGESAYWRYESALKRADSQVSTTIGALGEFFAIRRTLYRPLEEDSIIEDFVLSMRLVMEGWRVVYEPAAVTWEEASPTLRGEWTRRVRMAAGGFQVMRRLCGLLSPRYGLIAFQYFSHKVLRWLAPLFMLLALGTAAALTPWPFYRFCFWGQIGFYALAGLGGLLEIVGVRFKWLRIPFYFCFTNAAVLWGLVRYLSRKQTVLWARAR